MAMRRCLQCDTVKIFILFLVTPLLTTLRRLAKGRGKERGNRNESREIVKRAKFISTGGNKLCTQKSLRRTAETFVYPQ